LEKESVPKVHFFMDNHFFSVSPDQTVGYGIADMPDYLEFIAPYKCAKCGAIFIYEGTCNLVESSEREMGDEVFYNVEDDIGCECGVKVTVEFDLSQYAGSWCL
jgi:hypothetical protein